MRSCCRSHVTESASSTDNSSLGARPVQPRLRWHAPRLTPHTWQRTYAAKARAPWLSVMTTTTPLADTGVCRRQSLGSFIVYHGKQVPLTSSGGGGGLSGWAAGVGRTADNAATEGDAAGGTPGGATEGAPGGGEAAGGTAGGATRAHVAGVTQLAALQEGNNLPAVAMEEA